MYKSLPIESCIQCYNLRWQPDHEYYYCDELDTVIEPSDSFPKDCPLETIKETIKENNNV